MTKFDVRFLEQAKMFLDKLDSGTREKILFNIWKSKKTNNPELFKKLDDEIREFRTRFKNRQIRLLAFWDRREKQNVLVIACHGFIKKTKKTPKKKLSKRQNSEKIISTFKSEIRCSSKKK